MASIKLVLGDADAAAFGQRAGIVRIELDGFAEVVGGGAEVAFGTFREPPVLMQHRELAP